MFRDLPIGFDSDKPEPDRGRKIAGEPVDILGHSHRGIVSLGAPRGRTERRGLEPAHLNAIGCACDVQQLSGEK